MKPLVYNCRGFSLIEILVVLAVLALLATFIVPSVGGFISGGKEKAWRGERETLQFGVDAWRNTVGKDTGITYPILTGGDREGCLGALTAEGEPTLISGCNPYLDILALATEGFLRNAASVKSTKTSSNTTEVVPKN